MKKRNIKEIANQMVVCLSREIKDNEKVFHGVNSQIPMVAIFLAKKMHAPNLVLIEVAGSINPEPRFMPKSTNGPELCHGSASLFSNADTYDLFARGAVDLIFLGGAQIDKNCNVNMSYIGDPNKPKVRLPGGGGGSVIMSQAKRTIIWKTKHDKRVFVDNVDFVTQTGNLEKVVTPKAVFKNDEGKLELESIHSCSSKEEVIEQTSFKLKFTDKISETISPTDEEKKILEEIDPNGTRFIEFGE
tara:strand:- start:824 stop:1558 length:735 start_codon:yes stop_codon:yes gene_type:complete